MFGNFRHMVFSSSLLKGLGRILFHFSLLPSTSLTFLLLRFAHQPRLHTFIERGTNFSDAANVAVQDTYTLSKRARKERSEGRRGRRGHILRKVYFILANIGGTAQVKKKTELLLLFFQLIFRKVSDVKKEKELAERRKNDPALNHTQDHLVRKLFSKFKRAPSSDVPSGGRRLDVAERRDVEKGAGAPPNAQDSADNNGIPPGDKLLMLSSF